jgi:V8-like Glu-specific endopeptidase
MAMSYTTQTAEDEYSPFVTPSRNAPTGRSAPRRVESPFVEQFEAWTGEDEGPDAPGLNELGVLHEGGTHPNCTKSGIGIHGNDDRQPVADTLVVPSRWICQLWIRHRDSNGVVTESGATGVLVSPRHVLTVAHALHSTERDSRNQPVTKEAIAVRVRPGRNGSDEPFGAIWARLPARLSPRWSHKTMPADQDYALLTLDTRVGDKTFPRLGGAKLCYWGAASCGHRAIAKRVPPQTLAGATAFTSGYPKDRGNGESPLHGSGVLSGVVSTRRLMSYSADACQGQSGSPVWVNVGGELRLVGILVMVLPTTTLVLRVTRELSRQLRAWLGSESAAFLGEVTAPTGSTPEAEWDTAASESDAAAESSEGAWIDAPKACRCCSASPSADREDELEPARFSSALSDADESPSDEWEAPASYAEDASHAEWEGVTGEEAWESAPDAGEGVELGEAEPSLLESIPAEAEDAWLPEQQAPAPATSLRFLPFMTDIKAPLDPGFYTPAGGYQTTPSLQTLVDAVAKLPAARGVKLALVDLSKGLGSPEFAGIGHTTALAVGSVGKAAVMYAAFQLRAQIRRLLAQPAFPTPAAAFTAMQTAWLAMQGSPAGAPVAPVAGHLGRRGDLMTWKGVPISLSQGQGSLPNFPTIFGAASPVDFDSKSISLVSTFTLCDEFAALMRASHNKEGGDRKRRFLQRMRLMTGFSDNNASGTCIDDLGSSYVASVMVQSGLWHPTRGGIWLSGNYAGRGWRKSPLGGFVQNGTAGAVAALMTLLARNLLVDAAASAEMRALLLKGAYPGAGTYSPVRKALNTITARRSKVVSKLGLIDNTTSDAAIVERTELGKRLHYVVVILGVPDHPKDTTIINVALALDNCIRRHNGLP